MSDEEQNQARPAPRKKGRMRLLVMLLVLLLLAGGGGAAAYFLLLKSHAPEEGAAEGEATAHKIAIVPEPEEPLPPALYANVPDVLANLQSDDKRPAFVRLGLAIAFTDPGLKGEAEHKAFEEKINEEMPRVVNILQAYLRSLSVDDFQGSAATYALHKQLLLRVKTVLPDEPVQDVLIRGVLLQ